MARAAAKNGVTAAGQITLLIGTGAAAAWFIGRRAADNSLHRGSDGFRGDGAGKQRCRQDQIYGKQGCRNNMAVCACNVH